MLYNNNYAIIIVIISSMQCSFGRQSVEGTSFHTTLHTCICLSQDLIHCFAPVVKVCNLLIYNNCFFISFFFLQKCLNLEFSKVRSGIGFLGLEDVKLKCFDSTCC